MPILGKAVKYMDYIDNSVYLKLLHGNASKCITKLYLLNNWYFVDYSKYTLSSVLNSK